MTYTFTKTVLNNFAESAKAKSFSPEYASDFALGVVLTEFALAISAMDRKTSESILEDIQARTTK